MLRPVPSRPHGPVDPAEARAFAAASLPAVDEAAVSAFSLVVLAGLPRSAVPGLSPDEVSIALASARKEVRRAACPLPGSGWCERAERLISERLDDCLDDSRLLDVHLANCPRCVEHERRLVQAQDALVASFAAAQPAPASPPSATPPPPPALTVIEEPPPAAPPAAVEPKPATPRSAAGLAWGVLAVLALLLTLVAVGAAVAGALGAGL